MITFCNFYAGVNFEEFLNLTKRTAEELNWKFVGQEGTKLSFSTGFNWSTWGQKINIDYVSINSANITVETKLYQVADSGSGGETIKEFIEHYQQLTT